jgi:S1-C subfamily serine protease
MAIETRVFDFSQRMRFVFPRLSTIEPCIRMGFPWRLCRCHPILVGRQEFLSSKALALDLESTLHRGFIHRLLLVLRRLSSHARPIGSPEIVSHQRGNALTDSCCACMPEGKVVTSADAGTLAVPDDVVPRSLEEVPHLNRSPLRLMVLLSQTTVFTLLTVLIANSAAAQEKPSRVEIGRRGKAATVLVLVGDRSGSAFCIHPAGFYVTNEHIVRGAVDRPVRLVLNSTLNSQRVVKARVVRTDNARDLALLKADGVTDAAVLPIASSDEVSELAEVIAFGFPFGTALSVRNEEYPAISVNVCTVSALRNKNGALDRIELNGSVNPGQSGGPVLDSAGNVVGVIASGIRGSGISQSIPSLHLMQFLELPDIQLLIPEFDTPAAAAKPATFRAKVSTLLPGRDSLRCGSDRDRR